MTGRTALEVTAVSATDAEGPCGSISMTMTMQDVMERSIIYVLSTIMIGAIEG